MEKEILAVHKSLKKGKKQRNKTRLDPLAGQEFKVFCSDYIAHFYMPPCGMTKRPGSEADMVYGNMYFDSNTHCHFGPLRRPKRASRKAVKVKTSDGKHELSFKFIGNRYLKLKVSWEFVSTARGDPCPPDPPRAAPEVFKFVGIKRDREKETAERQKLARVAKARRSPSPPETWFEISHPMEWWHSRYL
ncbi:hypothetical protein MFIFM68171_02214 [Madurella fahalii]|uniref:Uncharacterized protein n=1 Tax=Madurella fahalii TaxID=1157608 RepID=A0ABQ0G2N0_9PEZI